jgi:hypothetical protein
MTPFWKLVWSVLLQLAFSLVVFVYAIAATAGQRFMTAERYAV